MVFLIRPSKYCLAFEPESSDFAFTSFNLIIAFSFISSLAFNRHICCSMGIFELVEIRISVLVYLIVFFIACLNDLFNFPGQTIE